MADVKVETKESRCPGCARRTTGKHCTYPSNPVVNAASPLKRDPLSAEAICVLRRNRANSIKLQNAGA